MSTENSIFNAFTQQYKLSKTLRFELKPIGKTAEWIEHHDIIGVKDETLIGKDAQKAKHYKYAKRILDAMHRIFIEDTLALTQNEEFFNKFKDKLSELQNDEELQVDKELRDTFKALFDSTIIRWIDEYQREMPKFWEEDIQELKNKKAAETNNQRKKGFDSAIKAVLKKQEDPDKVIKKKTIEAIFSNEDALALLEWKIRSGAVKVSFIELEQGNSEKTIPPDKLCEFLRDFHKFSTYFTGFNENRKNVYDLSGEKSTSIIHRTITDNLSFHFANIARWQIVCSSLEKSADTFTQKGFDHKAIQREIEEKLQFSMERFFTVDTFCQSMNQCGIDRYNELIGGRPALDGSEKVKGINEFINLCRQQAGAKRQQFPTMRELHKQILSKSDRTFIPEFSDDKDLLQSIEKFHDDYFVGKNGNGKTLLIKALDEWEQLGKDLADDYENLFLPSDKVSSISNLITGHWSNLNQELFELLGDATFRKRKFFSFTEITKALEEGCKEERFQINDAFTGKSLINIFTIHFMEMLNNAEIAWTDLHNSGVLRLDKLDGNRENQDGKGFQQIAFIKTFLDAAIALSSFVRDWLANKEILKIENRNKTWYDHLDNFLSAFQVIGLYNMTRNHLSKKPTATEKLKINFENATLLDGWDRNKETANHGILLVKDNCFYLAIMTSKTNQMFDYEVYPSDSVKKAAAKCERRKNIIATSDQEASFHKMNYKLLPGANKMLPKVFFAESNKHIFSPSDDIIKIKNEKRYSKTGIEAHGKKALHDYIDFCIKSLCKHPEWNTAFNFTPNSFRNAPEYDSVDQFYREVELQGYTITFDHIKESFINEKVKAGELYLFQIYSKDFSKTKKQGGRDNLHTMYWKGLFSPENLENTVLKLNGQAEIFFRQASLKYCPEKMRTGHHSEILKDKFSYPIIKDRRFTENKFFFHCPITLNFAAASIVGNFNNKIRTFIKNNSDVNIIGIDRGEKHLLYYSIINQSGKILEQGSLNEISNGFIPRGMTESRSINYHSKLDAVEKKRDIARKSWSMIENIKELKAGYLSQVVHSLAKLIVKYNAIVVLEDLNVGFKRGRFGVEKQVYQKFERALIEKLNYLVFKDIKDKNQAGHFLNAFQLTDKFESFQKMGKQSGILFYTTASYTSTTDPVTGFLKNVYANYQNVAKSVAFWNSFDSIVYNKSQDRFEFTYTLGKVISKNINKENGENTLKRKSWTVCSCVTRSRYVKIREAQTEAQKQNTSSEQIGDKGRHETFFVTDELKSLLKSNDIDFKTNTNIKDMLAAKSAKSDASFHKSMIYFFNAIMTIRVSDGAKDKGSRENDYIQSPVEPFFDSRFATPEQPENGDANGSFNIARKGICILNKINQAEDVSKVTPNISKQEWQNFCQIP